MSYTPVLTSEIKVEGLTQIDITASTNPSTSEVLDWIEEIEKDVIERNLYTRTATDEYIDVPAQGGIPGGITTQITYSVSTDILRFIGDQGGYLVPLTKVKTPIISMTSLSKNDEDPSDTASWDALTEGPADASSYMLLTSGIKGLGYALWFYDNFPVVGPKRLKATYSYGYNLDTEVLDRYCTLGVAIKVLQARRGTSSADGLSEFTGGSLGNYVPTQYSTRMQEFEDEMIKIANDHFPKPEAPMAIINI